MLFISLFTSVLPHQSRPYNKGRTSNSSLYSRGDPITVYLWTAVSPEPLRVLSRIKIASTQSQGNKTHVTILCCNYSWEISATFILILTLFKKGWSTSYLNVDGEAVSSDEKTNLDSFLCSEKLRLEALHIFPDWVNNMVCRSSGPLWAAKHPTIRKLLHGLWISNSVPIPAKVLRLCFDFLR